jgi:hypothetical protein
VEVNQSFRADADHSEKKAGCSPEAQASWPAHGGKVDIHFPITDDSSAVFQNIRYDNSFNLQSSGRSSHE